MLTQERLKELLTYNAETGVFQWAISDRNRKAGVTTGYACQSRRGVVISVDGRHYRAHRLAWLYVFGAWPENVVDHINGDWRDNRIENLRDVTQAVNTQNQRRPRSDSTTGMLGVRRNGSGWMAVIQTNGHQNYLGTFRAKEDAQAAYLTAKRATHEGCSI